MSPLEQKLTVFVGDDHTSANSILNAVRKTAGSFLCVLPPSGLKHIDTEPLKSLLLECRAFNRDRKLLMATKDGRLLESAEREGWETIKTVKGLKLLIKGQASEDEALRAFSPVIWRENIRTKLQTAGILSLPKVRIWMLFILSVGAFLYTFFKLLPSSEIFITPNQETGTFTTNMYLSVSGAHLPISQNHVRTLPLTLLTIHVDRTLTYDQISKKFTGTNAYMTVTIFNDADEPYSLRRGTRILNQAGMKFRLLDQVILDPHTKVDVRAEADPIDQYGEVLGQRGNVPGGVKWYFPGLSERERTLVYARNANPATGGTTSYVNVLTKEDIVGTPHNPGAKQRLEQELLMVARQQVSDEIENRNQLHGSQLVLLQREELTKVIFSNFALSESFIGQNIATIPLQGSLDYTVILYDENELLSMMRQEVLQRVPTDKTILPSSIARENMSVHVIPPWDSELSWVKITASLTYNQRYILNPITPTGAKFGKYIRDNVAGKSSAEAFRIIRNLPEVSKVEISLWPPWTKTLPEIGSSIAITEKEI